MRIEDGLVAAGKGHLARRHVAARDAHRRPRLRDRGRRRRRAGRSRPACCSSSTTGCSAAWGSTASRCSSYSAAASARTGANPRPATDRITLRIRNDRAHRHRLVSPCPEANGRGTPIRYEASGYHANTVGDLLEPAARPVCDRRRRGAVPRRHRSEESNDCTPRDPWTLSSEAPFVLRRDGAPALLVGGQVFNSASSSPKAIADALRARPQRRRATSCCRPVSWDAQRARRGRSSTSRSSTSMLAEARRERPSAGPARGSARSRTPASTYAPTLGARRPAPVPARRRRSRRQCRRSRYEGATAKPVLSRRSRAELREADAEAFEALMTLLRGCRSRAAPW